MDCIIRRIVTLSILLTIVVMSVPVSAETFRVNVHSTATSPDGHTWDTAFVDIQSAVDAAYAVGGGEVWVAAGTYTATSDPVLTMRENVTIYGGFTGIETFRDERDWILNKTIIDGENIRRCVIGANAATLDGLSIRLGYCKDNGGGIYNETGSQTLCNCIIEENTSESYGGGMYNGYPSEPILTNCMLKGNVSSKGGGGISNHFSNSKLSSCELRENKSSGGSGIYNSNSSLEMEKCIISDNISMGNEYLKGGGIVNDSSSLLMTSCYITGNKGVYGGGIRNEKEMQLTNCVIENNSSNYGGGIFCDVNSDTQLMNCTIVANMADEGGGLYVLTDSAWNEFSLVNCIVWDNSCENYLGYRTNTGLIEYTCIQGVCGGEGSTSAYPLFWNPLAGDYRLHVNSPCLNTGTPIGAPLVDIAETPRPQGSGIDMGAYEWIEVDSDGDRLMDDFETTWSHTDPENADTNGNGVSDGDEWFGSHIWHVNSASTAESPDGVSWETAFQDIQSAVDNTYIRRGSGEIWIAKGTYTSSSENVVTMRYDTHLYGGFDGTEINREDRDWERNPTIIDGELKRRCVAGSSDSTFDGFNVTRGAAFQGGGMHNIYVSSTTIQNCHFYGNTSVKYGGGIFNSYRSDPEVIGCLFDNNSAGIEGGGMCNAYYSSPTIMDCYFKENNAGSGGGISNFNRSSPVFDKCFVLSNSAGGGGGMSNTDYSFPHITDCQFIGNNADTAGGIYIDNGQFFHVLFNKCVINDNHAKYNGAGIFGEGLGPIYLINCLVAGNSSEELFGGGICLLGTPAYLSNCTIVNNAAPAGGALFGDNGGFAVIDNSIVWGNSSGVNADAEIEYSCIQDVFPGEGNIYTDPLFAYAANGDYRLRSGSPCIDIGYAMYPQLEDLTGTVRPQGAGFDLGAYEYVVDDVIPEIHSADINADRIIQLDELLRVIQFFNTCGYSCDTSGSSSDGYQPGNGDNYGCRRHASDFDIISWKISISELLRLVQFFNIGGYYPCPLGNTDDGYCPGTGL